MADNDPCRDFDLPEEDTDHLNTRGGTWETVKEGGAQWLLVHGFPLPDGYSQQKVTVAIQIPPNYLNAGLDMAYFSPGVSRADGVQIPASDYSITIQSRPYQRWSRHRTGQNPWRPGVDSIMTHLGLVEEWLLREFRLRPKG